jgi:hypothetical protein
MKAAGNIFLGERPVAVFSQPNHELAVLGILHTLNCPIIFLSDGGAPQRIVQTTLALRVIRHRAPVLCLSYSERSIYQALWRRDAAFFNSMAVELASRLSALRAGAVLTSPMEFHNPINDIASVLCRRADGISGLQAVFYDAPLIYQDPRSSSHLINRFPPSPRSGQGCAFELPFRLLTAKLVLFESCYDYLQEYLRTLRCTRSEGMFRMEHYRRAPELDLLDEPFEGYRARYDARGKQFKKAGAIQEAITYRGHFLPTMRELAQRRESKRVRR